MSSVECKLVQHTHLEQVDDPGGFPATLSNRLQDKAAGHHLPSDGVHTGTGQRLLEHGLQGQHAHARLRGTFNMSPKPWKLAAATSTSTAGCFYLSGPGADAAEVSGLAEVAAGRICQDVS